jgi:predicted LPLAT superfamily acyltransferase
LPDTANPGPGWGPAVVLWAYRHLPRAVFRPVLMAGTWVALAVMRKRRGYSREYLEALRGGPVGVVEMWRHFLAFMESLILNLRVGTGETLRCEVDPRNRAAFESLVASDEPALFGTFHMGCSDLLGYLLSDRGRRVSILRLRVGNSHDTDLLGERYGERVSFLWVNDPQSLLFDIKEALDAGLTLAMKCDRLEFSSKSEMFDFLGEKRRFPFTIYHLAVLFKRPVVFCVAVAGEDDSTLRLLASPIFSPAAGAGRDANLQAARAHFQGVLADLEALLRARPYQWFNFIPLNPAV